MRKGDVFFGGTLVFAALVVAYTAVEIAKLVDYQRIHPQETKIYEGPVLDERLSYQPPHYTFAVQTSQGHRTFHVLGDDEAQSLDSRIRRGDMVRIEILGRKGIEQQEMYISGNHVTKITPAPKRLRN